MIKWVRDRIDRQLVDAHACTLITDKEGLTILAWALGAALVVAPLTVALFAFSNDAVDDVGIAAGGMITG